PPWAPPMAFAPAPLPPYPPAPRRGTSPRTWALVGGAAALTVTLVTLVSVMATAGGSDTTAGPAAHQPSTSERPSPSTTTTPPAGPPVQAEELPTLLLDTGAINTIMGTRDLVVNPTLTTTRLYIDTTDRPECGGVWANANKGVYAGSGWVAVQTQYLREPADPRHEVFQSVVSFPTASAATDFVAKEAKGWPLCNGRSITTTTPNNPPQTWWVATVSHHDGLLTSVINREGAHGWGCQHALTSRNNVVVDVETCGFSVQEQASEIAGKVAQGIH
ncbi:sensor domain-containing protein, partial [Mycobacterium sp. Marseille-P9652]|uniref:sensor domain-containing protein n=1 Tax=Mycobacterium sp. Marseille-P9652 TaxID=2654950 RepID=UPI001E63A81A